MGHTFLKMLIWETCIVNTKACIEMLDIEMSPPDVWYQQDGETSRTSLPAMAWWRNVFENSIISHQSDFPWPDRFSDLSPQDYFIWAYVKQRVFFT